MPLINQNKKKVLFIALISLSLIGVFLLGFIQFGILSIILQAALCFTAAACAYGLVPLDGSGGATDERKNRIIEISIFAAGAVPMFVGIYALYFSIVYGYRLPNPNDWMVIGAFCVAIGGALWLVARLVGRGRKK